MFLGNGMGLILKAGYFLAITRCLGSSQYGAFIGVTSLVAVLAPYATLGSGNLLVKNVSRDKTLFSVYWGNCLFMTIMSGLFLLALVLGISSVVLPKGIPLVLIILVGIGDLIFARAVDASMQAFQAFDMLKTAAQLSICLNGSRLLGAIVLINRFVTPTARTWAGFYLFASFATAMYALFIVTRKLGLPRLGLSRIRAELSEGFFFSVSLSAQSIYNDIDKTMLARLSTLDAVGIYAAAYRLVDVSFVPVRSLLNAAYAGFFRHGSSGIAGSREYAKRLLPRSTGYGLVACLSLIVFAPVVPRFLGPEYSRTVEALRWVAPITLLRSMHYFFADTLTGAGYQGVRTSMQAIVAGLNVVLNLWLIPAYSWRGAAWASLASDGSLLLSLFVICTLLNRREFQRGGGYTGLPALANEDHIQLLANEERVELMEY